MSTEPVNFTETFLKALRDGQMPKRYYADTKAPGLVVRRLPTGTVAFYFRYRKGGKQSEMRVGIWGKKVTLEQARTKAKKLLGEVADGRDPAGEKSAAGKQAIDAKTNTLSHVIDLHVEDHVKKLRTAKAVTSALERVKNKIGHLWIRDVKRPISAAHLNGPSGWRGLHRCAGCSY
ncbi:Arm DNA-binding domain-containing protein [Leptospira interrogans]